MQDISVETEERDTISPTTACAKCDSLDVYLLEDESSGGDKLICASCHVLLKLVIDSIDSR